MAQRTIEVLEFLLLVIERPDFDGIIVHSYKLVGVAIQKRNVSAFLILLITGWLEDLRFAFVHVPND